MKLNTFKRIIKEDVKEEYRELVEKLAFSINPFAEEVVKALNKNLSVSDNFNQQFRDVMVEVDSSGIPKQALQFKTNLISGCKGIITLRAINTTSSTTYPTGYPFLTFTELNGILTVNHITGLPANNKFTLKILLYP